MKTNPLGLPFGARVTAKRTCSVVYQGNEKVLTFHEVPFTGLAIGLVKKALGTYVPGNRGYFDLEDYVEPRLKVSRYVWLYVIQAEFGGLQYLAAPEDIHV